MELGTRKQKHRESVCPTASQDVPQKILLLPTGSPSALCFQLYKLEMQSAEKFHLELKNNLGLTVFRGTPCIAMLCL